MEGSDAIDAYRMYRSLFDGYDSHEIGAFFVGEDFWPRSYTEDSSAARVRACNNPDKSEYWKLAELIAWADHVGRAHVFLYFLCDAFGFERPLPIGDTEVQALRSELEQVESRRRELIGALAARVGGSHRELAGGARFSLEEVGHGG